MIRYFYCSEYWLYLFDLNCKEPNFKYNCFMLLNFSKNNTNHCSTIKDACYGIISCLNKNNNNIKYDGYYIVEYDDEYLYKYSVLDKKSNINIYKFEDYYNDYKYLLLIG